MVEPVFAQIKNNLRAGRFYERRDHAEALEAAGLRGSATLLLCARGAELGAEPPKSRATERNGQNSLCAW